MGSVPLFLFQALDLSLALTKRGRHERKKSWKVVWQPAQMKELTKVATSNYNVAMIQAGIKDLKNRLSDYLREVKKGQKILVTERKRAIATIVPVDRADEDSMLISLVKEGLASWKGGKPSGSLHPVKVKGKTISAIVLKDRR